MLLEGWRVKKNWEDRIAIARCILAISLELGENIPVFSGCMSVHCAD